MRDGRLDRFFEKASKQKTNNKHDVPKDKKARPPPSRGTAEDKGRGELCVFLGSTEAALMGNFTPISRRPAKCAMRTAWVHSGALRAPLCIQGDVMAHFAGQREIGVKFSMRAASVEPKSTQLTPLTISVFAGVGKFRL